MKHILEYNKFEDKYNSIEDHFIWFADTHSAMVSSFQMIISLTKDEPGISNRLIGKFSIRGDIGYNHFNEINAQIVCLSQDNNSDPINNDDLKNLIKDINQKINQINKIICGYRCVGWDYKIIHMFAICDKTDLLQEKAKPHKRFRKTKLIKKSDKVITWKGVYNSQSPAPQMTLDITNIKI